MEEIFAMVQRDLMRSGVVDGLASGIVLVGGTSLLEGTRNSPSESSECRFRRGLSDQLERTARRIDEDTMFTTRRGTSALPEHRARVGNGVGAQRPRAARQAPFPFDRLGEGRLLSHSKNQKFKWATNLPVGGGGGSVMIELVSNPDPGARIKVMVLADAAGNAVNHMINVGLSQCRLHRCEQPISRRSRTSRAAKSSNRRRN